MSEADPVLRKVGRSIEGAIEAMRWCRQHPDDVSVTVRLRELGQAISAVALALDHEMNGETDRARRALEKTDWLARPSGAAGADLPSTGADTAAMVAASADQRDLLMESALEASRLLGRVVNSYRDDPEFVQAVSETIRRIYALDAARAHDG